MIVAVWARFGDFCGNETFKFYGLYECMSVEQARAIFPHGHVCGWYVEEHVIRSNPLPSTTPRLPNEKDMEYGRFNPA